MYTGTGGLPKLSGSRTVLISVKPKISVSSRKRGMCASLRFQRMATNVDGCVLITEISSTETAAVTQNTSLPS